MVFRYVVSRHPIHQLRHEMDRLFNAFASNAGEVSWPWSGRGRPAVNVWESQDAVQVEMELPGLKAEQVEISVVGEELSVKVERPDTEPEGATFHRRERPVGSFTRLVRLPMPVDADRVEAELRHGVLTITLPKAESARPRKIRVASTS